MGCGLGRCGSGDPGHKFSSRGTWAQGLHDMWDLPGYGIEPVSPALAGGFFTTEPLWKPSAMTF